MCVSGGLWQGIDRSHSWVNSAYAPGGSRSVLRRNPNSSCELKQVPNPPLLLLLPTTSTSFLNRLWSPLVASVHTALPISSLNSQGLDQCAFSYPPLGLLSQSSPSQLILSPLLHRPFLLCCVRLTKCLPGILTSLVGIRVHRGFSGHPLVSFHPFSHHFVLISVFASPSLHVRQVTAAAIACLPFWTAWPCFQFPQGRLPRR